MITYKPCTDVSSHQIYEAFRLGFSDYMIPLRMEEAFFHSHFFGPEGNHIEHSYIALDESNPIGLILGGIRSFDGLKTMRCGALCLGSEYRGMGISQKLFDLHLTSAKQAECRQLFLEVIRDNHRAIRFYKKLGYLPAHILKYYSIETASLPCPKTEYTYEYRIVTYEELKKYRNQTDCHINWQSDVPYYENNTDDLYLGIYEKDRPIAMSAISAKGNINFLRVEPVYRFQGLGHSLLYQAIQLRKFNKLSLCIPGNSLLEGFARKLNFNKNDLEQYEMYLPL